MAICVAAIAVFAWLNRPRDEPTKATVSEAVWTFRAQDAAGGRGGGPGEPALGVYRYATRGSESVRNAVLSTTHHYGRITTIAISPGRCGERERWQALAGRWTEVEACGPHGERLAALVEFHEFFGFDQEDVFRCHGEARVPRDLDRGDRFASACTSDGSLAASSSRVVGTTRMSVGDRTFDAVHVRSKSVVGGDDSGSATRDEWRRRSDGLLLRRSAESEADTSEGGDSHYSERYTLRLLSTAPER